MFLSIDNLLNFRFWIFIFIMCSITSHMSLSSADLKNSEEWDRIYIFIIDCHFIIRIHIKYKFKKHS